MKNQKTEKILYISSDGILHPIGEAQILSYLEKLCNDFDFYLITFEKKNKLNTNVHRKIKTRVREDRSIPEGVIFMPFCYEEAAANLLTNSALDPFGKIPEFKYCAAKIDILN